MQTEIYIEENALQPLDTSQVATNIVRNNTGAMKNYSSGRSNCQSYMKTAKNLNKKLPPKKISSVSLADESVTPTCT